MGNKAIFHSKRDNFRAQTTLGNIFSPNDKLYCHVLEDTVRPYGIKDKGRTAIPATEGDDTYFIRVMPSAKYGKVVTVFTHLENGIPVLEYGGIRFTYVRCHGGNSHEDSDACLLVNKNRDVKSMKAWGSMREDFTEEIEELTKQGYDCRLRVSNLTQES